MSEHVGPTDADLVTMNRVIHGAVRRDLDRTEKALLATTDGDGDRVAEIGVGYGFLVEMLTRHHEGEDDHLWPWLRGEGVDPELLDAMESEHQDLSAALAAGRAAIETAAASGTLADARAAAQTVAETRHVVNAHLAHEEAELEPHVQSRTDTPGWKAVEKKLRAGSITDAGSFFAWVTDGMRPEHEKHLRETVPAPVVKVLGGVFGRRYTKQVAPVWRR